MSKERLTDSGPVRAPSPLKITRTFHARRETVFRAWTTAEHVRRWFCPESFAIPELVVETRVGGRFEICMRSPTGEDHWIRGRFVEIAPPGRLVIDMRIADSAGKPLFEALTEADFSDVLGGTQLDLVQTYTLLDPAAAGMLAGAPEGWRSTLDKLEREVVAMTTGADRTAVR